jgi:uncharacterized protein (DUF342 family)
MTSNSSISSKLLTATVAHFKSQRDQALATLAIYFENPVAIGEHPGILEEIKTLTKQLSEAEEALQALESHFHY